MRCLRRDVTLRTLAAIGVALVSTGAARADEPRKLDVRYEAPPGCPDGDTFRADLARRTPRIAISKAGDAELYDVKILATEGGFEGTLRAADVEPHAQRGRRCAAVAGALALTLALSIDPSSKTDPVVEPKPELPPPPPPAPTPSPPGRVIALALGVDALPAVVSPGLGGVVLGLESRGETRIATLFRARLILAGQGEPSERARLGLGAIGLDACVFRLATGALSVRPCIGLEPGVMSAEARNVASPSNGTAIWLSTSARLRVDVGLTKRFGLTVEGAAMATLVRPRFVIDPPRSTATEVRPLGAEIAVSAWVTFP